MARRDAGDIAALVEILRECVAAQDNSKLQLYKAALFVISVWTWKLGPRIAVFAVAHVISTAFSG